jgi:nucleotide-binding universal stress UspA family protein
MPAFQRILCPIDFSEPSHKGLQKAIELAGCFPAELLLVHVVPPVPMAAIPQAAPAFDVGVYQKQLTSAAEDGLDAIIDKHVPDGVRTRSIVADGEPAQEIVRIAEDESIDLVVMSTHGESGWRRFVFGSVAEKVVRTAHCSVMTVPEPRSGEEQ